MARYPASEDGEGFAHYNAEIYESMFRTVIVFPFETKVESHQDNIYGEDMTQTWPKISSYKTPCFIANYPEWKSKVTKVGVDEDRPLMLFFNKDLIVNHPIPAIGFHILIEEERYRVFQETPSDYFANYFDQFYTHIVLVQRYRPESVSRGEIYP